MHMRVVRDQPTGLRSLASCILHRKVSNDLRNGSTLLFRMSTYAPTFSFKAFRFTTGLENFRYLHYAQYPMHAVVIAWPLAVIMTVYSTIASVDFCKVRMGGQPATVKIILPMST